MAVKGRITVDASHILCLDADPSGTSTTAPLGSLAMLNNTAGGIFQKSNTGGTDWQSINRCLFTQTATATVANTTAKTSLIGSGVGTTTMPAGFLIAGRTIYLSWYGTIADLLTPTLIIKFEVNGTAVATSTTLTLPALTGTVSCSCEVMMTCRTVGSSGTVFTQGLFKIDNASVGVFSGMVNTATNTVDTTVSRALDLTATWGTASASDTISGTNCLIEVTN